jgi:transposase
VGAAGVALAVTLTGGNRNDITRLPLVYGMMPVAGKVGQLRQRPDQIVADRGYYHDSYRHELWRRGVKPIIARRGTEHGSGLGRWRWVVERTFSRIDQNRRMSKDYERLLCASGETLVYAAMIRLMLRRLIRL